VKLGTHYEKYSPIALLHHTATTYLFNAANQEMLWQYLNALQPSFSFCFLSGSTYWEAHPNYIFQCLWMKASELRKKYIVLN